jgi:hypothetical protein
MQFLLAVASLLMASHILKLPFDCTSLSAPFFATSLQLQRGNFVAGMQLKGVVSLDTIREKREPDTHVKTQTDSLFSL